METQTEAARPARPPLRAWELEVVGAETVTPKMRRVRFTAPDLGELTFRPGQDVVINFPNAPRRHYTIRHHDAQSRTLDIDFVLHAHGPAAEWARAAKPGDRIPAFGPRGRTSLARDVNTHVFLGDETCIPGIFAMLEALPAGARAIAFIEIADNAEKQTVETRADLTLTWIVRDAPAGPSRLVLDRLTVLNLPAEAHFYVIGETSNVRAQRHHLLERGVAKERITAEGYWRPGRIGGHDHV
jgi:NADPH-dependent ferric siderophore reductase